MKRLGIVLLVLAGLSAVWFRVVAMGHNEHPHDDVTVSALVTDSIVRGDGITMPFVQWRETSVDSFDGQQPLDYRPPLWSVLASPIALIVGDSYLALRLLSLLSGLLLLGLAYWTFEAIFDRRVAALTTFCLAFSYLMIDFSGNGSLYLLLTCLFLLFLRLLPAAEKNVLWLGLVLGSGMLLHQGTIALVATLLAWYAYRYGSQLLRPAAWKPLPMAMTMGSFMSLT